MRICNLVALGALAAVQAARYNILSLDAAKYKGYMTAKFVSYMEKYAYNVARRDFCIVERKSGRIAMPELFDMISGSETGAIIATTINLPNTNPETRAIQKNHFFADRAVQFFEENVDSLYRDGQMGWFPKLVIIVAAILIAGSFSYWGTFKLFQVSDFGERVGEL
jgi:patatin-like phospholipase/acyl hydrolase